MSMSDKKLPFSGNAILLEKIATNFDKFVDSGAKEIPREQIYKVECDEESPRIDRNARKAALSVFKEGSIKKVAFDVRRIDQELDRNPRTNLQNWHRSDAFIENADQKKIEVFGKLFHSLGEIKDSFEREPGWHESYARQLYDQVERALRVKLGDVDIYRPQFVYLEQLIYDRYRISFEELGRLEKTAIKHKILEKDESLLKRGAYIYATNTAKNIDKSSSVNVKTGDNVQTTQEALIKAIFGGDTGGKKGSKTITITIKNDFEE